MRVLITGGTGTISSGLVEACVNNGIEVYAITRGTHSYRNVGCVHYIKANVWDKDEVAQKIQNMRFDVVIECLAYSSEQLKMSLDNFSTICNQYIFISTAGVYSRKTNDRIKESDKKELVQWKYTEDKILCENYLKKYCEKTGLKYTIIRPVVTYGNYRVPFPVSTRKPAWSFFQRISDGKPMLACDNVKFSIIHIEDFADAVIKLLNNKSAINEDFHIAVEQGEQYWDDVIEVASKQLQVVPLIIHVPLEVFGKYYNEIYDELKWNKTTPMLMDCTKIKQAVPKFCPQIPLEEGIRKIMRAMYNEVQDQKIPYDNEWDKRCDAIIYYAYKKKYLSEDEKEKLDIYYKKLKRCELLELKIQCWKMQGMGIFIKIKECIKKIVRLIKGLVKERYNDRMY